MSDSEEVADVEDIKVVRPENEASELDEQTHRELALLYEEAARNVLFAKAQQWRTVIYATVVHGAIVAIGIVNPGDERLAAFLLGAIFVVAVGAVLLLLMYQVWQHNEQRRMRHVADDYSSYFREIRDLKSVIVADFHRYAVLFGLILFVILATIITLRILWVLGS